MLLDIILLIIGFVVLIKGADFFVDGASSLARNFKLSAMFVGLTIVAFGTSAPELAVSIQALLRGNGDMILGNIIGSNILNIFLILGLSSLFHALVVKKNTVKKELPITLLFSFLFVFLINDKIIDGNINSFSRLDGIVMLLFFGIFIYYLVYLIKKNKEDTIEEIKYNIPNSILFSVIGLICIVLGSHLVVENASSIAIAIGISQRMVALTIIALGTSLPELVTSITATRKGEYDIAIGNVVGSGIFNLGVVLALPVAIFGGINNIAINVVDIVVFLLAIILLFIFSSNDRKITKKEGIVMLIIFVVYYSYVILNG